jgi:hypothetical protein
MPDGKSTPLDLSLFDKLESPAAQPQSLPIASSAPLPAVATGAALPAVADERLAPTPAPERLVEIANLTPEDLAAAQASAAKVDFRDSATLLQHGEGVLAGIAQASRQLLTGVRTAVLPLDQEIAPEKIGDHGAVSE